MPDTCATCVHATRYDIYTKDGDFTRTWCERRHQHASEHDAACQYYQPRGLYPIGKTRQEMSLTGQRRESDE